MKLSIHTDRLERRFGAIAAVKMIAEAGFEAIDYSMYYSDSAVFGRGGRILASELKRVAESLGLVFNQSHAPFSDFRYGIENEGHNRTVYNSICDSAVIASRLGAKTLVVHPAVICPRLSRDARFEMNMELFSRIAAFADNYGVGISIENLYPREREDGEMPLGRVCADTEELIRYADALSDKGVTVCFDAGHAGLVGESAAGMVKALGERVKYIHLHDNDFKTDSHTLPYLANTNYSSLCKALARVGYSGDVTLESDGFISEMPDGLIPSALLFSRSVAAYIRDEIIKHSKNNSAY